MSAFKLWKEEYRIGNEKIDEQHQELFRKVEELLSIAMTGNEAENKKECLEILAFLISYTIYHFETEEALQKAMEYVSYIEHVRIHEEFKNTVLSYKEMVEKDFSKETLKKLAGTLMTWLTVHVCDCDKKIMKNELISPDMSFDDEEDLIRRVAVQLLSGTYGVGIHRASSSMYKGYIEGKIIVRTIISVEKNHVFLFGFSEEMARGLYKKISGMEIGDMDELNSIERSALIELGDILASHALVRIDDQKKNISYEWRGDIYLNEYSDSCIDITNSVLLDFDTDCGRLEIMYCIAGTAG